MTGAATIEATLRTLAAGGTVESLIITYSDMHGLWGGVTLTAAFDGHFERQERRAGEPAASTETARLSAATVADLARLLLEIRAWEQHVPEAPPLPDESRATLEVRCDQDRTIVWERFNDLERNARLARVREYLQRADTRGD